MNSLSSAERRLLIELDNNEITIIRQCELLGINRTTLYYKPREVPESELKIKHRIDEIHTLMPYCGYRKITSKLKDEGHNIGTTAVRTHMKEMGIRAIYPMPKTSIPNKQHKKYPYLLKGLDINKPNQVWSTDITYIRLKKGWLYLTAIIDWYSKYIISWELDQTLEIFFVLENADRALSIARPQIINTDQGSHYTSLKFIEKFESRNVMISMDGKGRALDNIVIERFWRNIKYEDVYLKDYEYPREARTGIGNYIDTYNNERPHQSLNYSTPAKLWRSDY